MTALAIRNEGQYLATVHEVRALAERCEHVSDAKDLADKARAAQVWAERARLGAEKVNLAAAARLWAERRAGELLAESVVPRGNHAKGREGSTKSLPDSVTKKESHRWQKLAAIDADDFAQTIAEMVPEGRITYAEIERRAKRREREETKREQEATLVREVREAGVRHSVEVADIRSFVTSPVAAIVTDPPYITDDAVELYAELRDFALRSLEPHGALVAMTWQPILLDVMRALDHPRLVYRWTVAWVSGAHESTADHARRVFDRWKPVLVYHLDGWHEKAGMLTDVVSSGRDVDKGIHEWQQGLDGFRQLIRAVSEPGDVICDPFVGGGTTALAALAEDRHFVGCDVAPDAVASTEARLAA